MNPDETNKNQVTMESHERWYRMLRVKLSNWFYKLSYRELDDFKKEDRLNFQVYENEMETPEIRDKNVFLSYVFSVFYEFFDN